MLFSNDGYSFGLNAQHTHPASQITVWDNIQLAPSHSNGPTVELFFILFDRILQLADGRTYIS